MDIKKLLGDKFIYNYTKEDWGDAVVIMEQTGIGMCRAYRYKDDALSIYFDWLSVHPNSRKQGLATELISVLHQLAKQLNAQYCYLWVKKDTWVADWYKRLGYEYYSENEDEPGCIWLKRQCDM